MLAVAAAAITLARKFGAGGFPEQRLRVYPSRREFEASLRTRSQDTRARPYPAAPDILPALIESGLPAASLLMQALTICRPLPTDARLRRAGEKYAARVASKETPLVKLALRAAYQWLVAKGKLPDRTRDAAVPRILV